MTGYGQGTWSNLSPLTFPCSLWSLQTAQKQWQQTPGARRGWDQRRGIPASLPTPELHTQKQMCKTHISPAHLETRLTPD